MDTPEVTPDIAIVIPNHLPHLYFLREWPELCQRNVALIVMQDVGFEGVVDFGGAQNLFVYGRGAVEKELGDDSWIIPQRTSACRSYGILKAWQTGAPIIATLDNDCYPGCPEGTPNCPMEHNPYWLAGHRANLASRTTLDWSPSVWNETTRGFPYGVRNASDVWLSHGLWTGVPDLDGPTALAAPRDLDVSQPATMIPRWSFFPMCSMNLAWRRELTPAMWHGLFGPDYGFDQYDDIWCGVLAKKVLDVLGKAAVSGAPLVEHRRQSSPFANLRKQAPGLEANEHFWRAVQRIDAPSKHVLELAQPSVAELYRAIVEALPDRIEGDEHLPPHYFAKFKRGALTWAGLFDGSRK